ncbi:serine hydrolase domain-containing protein [Geomicrobium sediminis]|uniref:CubicO group peptidase (Beta-lactamase class C family) n=1 Tax=Geomicrobium sediminis TaxID=1347788 RepID=A0ABS2PCK2_9BACL|nr:serine hydrolase domain-containing protein [Geomicrobium sediminis]MBM7633153.1 CubicO group peptidase (beta-lactamase class C family) [Geomicrobium sediminis]
MASSLQERRKWNELEAYIQSQMHAYAIPGASIAVSKNSQLVYSQGFGYRDLDQKLPVTKDTIFGVASITKSFTALAIMHMHDQKQLSIEDPVVQYLPQFSLRGGNTDKVTIAHLLSHTTGVPPLRRCVQLDGFNEHLNYLRNGDYESFAEPGNYFSYCNDTFLVLGAIIEKVSGQSYRAYMTEKLLKPLGLTRSTYDVDRLERLENVSIPYVYNKEKNRQEAVAWPKLGNYEVGGGIRSTAIDLIAYGRLYTDPSFRSARFPIRERVLKSMWRPLIEANYVSSYGYALQAVSNYEGKTLVGHGGSQPGVSSYFGFIPEEDTVIVVLLNCSDAPAEDLWRAVANVTLDLPLEQSMVEDNEYTMADKEKKRLLGAYFVREGNGEVQISEESGRLAITMDGRKLKLRAENATTLVIEETGKPLTFYLSEDGIAWGVRVGLRMFLRK